MKIAFQVEGPSDFAVLTTLTGRILDCTVEPVRRERRPGGVAAVKSTLSAVAWEFWRSDARGLVVVIDNDGQTPLHDSGHAGKEAEFAKQGCNFCQLQEMLPELPQRPAPGPFRFGIGVAVQQLEAWLLFGANHAGLKKESQPESIPAAQLKPRLYGSAHAPWQHREKICKTIADGVELDALEAACPSFGFFHKSVLMLKAK
jgi:hypothetical protein